jgi:hypothetical protein
MWNEFFKEMEKKAIAGAIMPIAMGGLTSMDVSNRIKENKAKMSLSPPVQNSQFELGSPNSYQFEGGKHTELKRTETPNMSMYQ